MEHKNVSFILHFQLIIQRGNEERRRVNTDGTIEPIIVMSTFHQAPLINIELLLNSRGLDGLGPGINVRWRWY